MSSSQHIGLLDKIKTSFKAKRCKESASIKPKEHRNRRQISSSRQTEPPSKSRLECVLDERIRKRFQRWCRVCLSEKCRLDHRDTLQATNRQDLTEGDFQEKLESFKNKRIALESYMQHIDKLNTCCHIGILRQPYIPSEKQLPPWLIGVIDKEISLPLIPTFPTSKESLSFVKSELGLSAMDATLQEEYISTASCVRRVRIGVAKRHFSDSETVLTTSSVCPLWLNEETSDGTVKSECLQDTKEGSADGIKDKDKLERKPALVEIITRHGSSDLVTDINLLHGNQSDLKDSNTSKSFPTILNPLQLAEQRLVWHTCHACTNAEVRECRNERILIEGSFRTADFDTLPFKLVLFPGQRSTPMQVKGTFIRRAECSSYSLRWRFDADIPTLA